MQPALLVGVRYLSRSLNKPGNSKLLRCHALLVGQPLQLGPNFFGYAQRNTNIRSRFASGTFAFAAPVAPT